MLWIGTSGWQYRDWRGVLYPQGVPQRRWLSAYASAFQTVEVNSTFYGLPQPHTFAGWAEQTPADFRMACKLSRYLTHVVRLRDPAPAVHAFIAAARHLGPKLGPLLLQLPPDMEADPALLSRTLALLRPPLRVAVEPRHPSWFADAVRACLEHHGAALCLADREGVSMGPAWATADFGYLRLHWGAGGGPGYARRELEGWLDTLQATFSEATDVFVYFNNDPGGAAVRDARQLAALATARGMPISRVSPG